MASARDTTCAARAGEGPAALALHRAAEGFAGSSSLRGSGWRCRPAHGAACSTTSLMGSWTRTSASPAWGGDHDGGHVVVADAARFDHRDVGWVDENVAVGVMALELRQVHFVGLPASPLCGSPGRDDCPRRRRAGPSWTWEVMNRARTLVRGGAKGCSLMSCGLGRGRGLFAMEVDDGGGFRRGDNGPRWTRRCGSGSCSGRRSTRCSTSVSTIATTSTSDDGSGKSWRAFGERAVRGRVAGPKPAAAVGVVRVSGAGTGARVAAVGDGPVEVVLGRQAGRAARDASTGLMPEQKLGVPACPRRVEWPSVAIRPEGSTRDCQADVCPACGLVRPTSYRMGQVVRYVGADDRDA